ncbi:amino acid adenylation domain-containing protein [Streptomyces sp.]|uniref:amino acid adenylation domain-containing protein n=1 Tax=Streptomyces sp. TaxID=1931 RepID=UPI002F3E91CB
MTDPRVPTGTEFTELVPALRRDRPWAAVSLPVSGCTPLPRVLVPVAARSVLELLSDWAEVRPEQVALAQADHVVTYQTLQARTARLAELLRLRGVEPGHVVPIVLGRSVLFFEAAVALWRLGAAFLPVDPQWPAPWRDATIGQTGSTLCLTTIAGPDLPFGTERVELDTLDLDAPPDDLVRWTGRRLQPSDVAYAVRTSGSTGEPKLVVVEHRGLTNLIAAQRAELMGMDGSAIVLQFCSPYFDSMIFEWAMALGSGGRLEIVGDNEVSSKSVEEVLRHRGITHTCLPAVLVRTMEPSDLPALRVLISSGEVCLPSTARLWAGRVQLVNGYGPTETTVCATMHTVGLASADAAVVPIGRPLPGTSLLIVDDELTRVPDGEPGEILIGGAGVARGYLGRPDLTAERFLPDSSAPGARLYRTGDLGRYRPDGVVEFLGRKDEQVKVRGYRVEPAEVELALTSIDGVRDAVVVAHQARLTGYVRLSPGHTVTGTGLRERLAQVLPGYLVPDLIVTVAQWPLRPNGKIDRSKLPSPLPLGADRSTATTPDERFISEVAAELLGVDSVGVHESLIYAGCNSLMAVQLVARVRDELGHTLPVSEVLRAGTVAAIAALLTDAAEHGPVPSPPDAPSAVSHAQERIWFAHESATDSIVYNGQCVLRLAGNLDYAALDASLTEIVRRHDVLRSRLILRDGGLETCVSPPWRVELPVVDLAGLDAIERDERVAEYVRDAVRAPFDIASDRLVRWVLIRIEVDEHLLIHTEHHAVHDAWAFTVFLHDLVEAYVAYQQHGSAQLPPLPIQYQDYARWHRDWCDSPAAAAQLDYWTGALAGASAVLPLPRRLRRTGRRTPVPGGRAAAAPRMRVGPDLARALEQFGRRHGATLYMVMLSAYFVVLHRMGGAKDLLVAAGAACRNWQATQDLLGMFINTVVLRGDLRADPTLVETLDRVRTVCLSSYDNQELPLEKVIADLDVPRIPGLNPLIQAAFNFHEAQPKSLRSVPLDITVIDGMNNGTAKFDLSVTVFPSYASPGHISRHEGAILHIPRSETPVHPSPLDTLSGLDVVWKYDTALFDDRQVLAMLAAYLEVLRAMAYAPSTHLSGIAIRHLLGDLPVEPELPRVRPRPRDNYPAHLRSDDQQGNERRSAVDVITRIVGEILGVPNPRGDEDFFALGGNSLLMTELLAAIRKEFAVSIKLEELLSNPTINWMAERLEKRA